MKLSQSVQTVVTLANASELAFNIAQGVLGNEVADSVNGQALTREAIYDMAQTQFQAALSPTLQQG